MNQVHQQTPRAGVLLVNLGTPDAPTAPAIRGYLREFLSDRRVVNLPRAIWLPFLYGFILPLRPRRLAHAYGQVWMPEGAPLLVHSERLATALETELAKTLPAPVPVRLAMRYGNPSIAKVLDELEREGVRRLVVLPMYPQYSATTTATVVDALALALRERPFIPELRTINSYHDHPAYIAALADSVRTHWAEHGRGEHLLMSFHGIPQRYFLAGDPYYCQCVKTGRLLAEALELDADAHTVTFQSRFGREPWLQPYTDHSVERLARDGVRKLDVVCPGFSADCLETLEEIAIENRDGFVGAGGEVLNYIPALNAGAGQLALYREIALAQLRDWLPPEESTAQIEARETRARALAAD